MTSRSRISLMFRMTVDICHNFYQLGLPMIPKRAPEHSIRHSSSMALVNVLRVMEFTSLAFNVNTVVIVTKVKVGYPGFTTVESSCT
ncbi:hypothetical protein TNCV_2661121 [Trichonephila clavipes]|nr:hypothetical protein TNCV_2661121 [Trichonephila clavipes]